MIYFACVFFFMFFVVAVSVGDLRRAGQILMLGMISQVQRHCHCRRYRLSLSCQSCFFPLSTESVMATNAPLLGNQKKANHSKASIFYGADEYLEDRN